ncbi:MAG: class I SAM-dependent methyltransferase [Acidobacteria bacterium]|nr:class I SAM-dependent methyltransferase [Acidobacteriota bacterium]
MTSLAAIRDAWEDLAEQDALGAILTDPSKTGGRWDIAEFMQTGEAEVETVSRHLSAIGHSPDPSGLAMDFGCGVGRLTQAMARRFTACVGVDISTEMIRNAQRLNQHARCSYQVVNGTQLPFADETFSFLYSNIVLQHVPRKFAVDYLGEFERVLKPGGILVFGVQDSFAAPDFSSRMIRVRHVLRICSRLKTAFGRSGGDMQMHLLPERVVHSTLSRSKVVDVRFTNTAAKDFNGRLRYLDEAPERGYVGKQYCVVKDGKLV